MAVSAESTDRPRTLPEMQADFEALCQQVNRYLVARDVLRAEQAMTDARGLLAEMQAHDNALCASLGRNEV